MKAILLDRDGVLLDLVPCEGGRRGVLLPEEVGLTPGICEALRFALFAGYRIALVTNQPCIARGLCTDADYRSVTARMRHYLGSVGDELPIFACHHLPEDECECRKPRPGLILQAAAALGVAVADCWVIGDMHRDVQAALSAGASPIYVRSGLGGWDEPVGCLAVETGAQGVYLAIQRDRGDWQ